MTSPADQPVRLSERLKQLDDAQCPNGLSPFDLDAVVLGGRRRRHRRRTMVGAMGVAAATVVIAANLTLTGSFQETVRPDTGPAPIAVVDSQQPNVTYRQREGTVTAYQDAAAVATLTLTSVTYNRSGGQLHVTATADRDFRFSAADFAWEAETGTDRRPVDPDLEVQVTRQGPQSLVIDFRKGSKGTVIWAPGADRVAGAWLVSASAAPVRAAEPTRVTYLQRDDTVSVYQGAALTARLTLASTDTDGTTGRLLLTVNAVREFSFPANQFIWEDKDGGDQTPLNGDRELRVDANSTKTLEIEFPTPGTSAVVWADRDGTVAGVWVGDR